MAKVGDEDVEKMSKDENIVDVEEEIKEKDVKEGDHGVEEKKGEVEEENVEMDVKPKTGVSFPVKLADGKQLMALGVRRKKVIALNINIYAFESPTVSTVLSSAQRIYSHRLGRSVIDCRMVVVIVLYAGERKSTRGML